MPLSGRGEVIVDSNMKAADDVYAAGDIARFPLPLIGDSTSIGHWQLAHNHGHVAARNMLGREEAFSSIPFFWTVMFGKSLRYCGRCVREGEGEGRRWGGRRGGGGRERGGGR